MDRIHVNVKGRVQGVSFRYFVAQNATKLGITGWVRNRFNSSVELIAEGEKEKLEQFSSLVHQGPLGSRVDAVELQWLESSGEFMKFEIRPTE